VVALRKNISRMKGENLLFDEIRYFFYITTRTDLSAEEVVRCALALMMHRKSDRRDYIRMEFRRFLHALILIPARVERRARGITIRLIGCHPTLDRLFGTWRMIESVGFT
jgi:hypothetical protein